MIYHPALSEELVREKMPDFRPENGLFEEVSPTIYQKS
jgi:hypothetical protein